MSGKYAVSKEKGAQCQAYRVIKAEPFTWYIQGLKDFQDNRECADCHSKAPQWASVNLGIFIHMQCSGIHQSWSAYFKGTIYCSGYVTTGAAMCNDKSNKYWEAELPRNSSVPSKLSTKDHCLPYELEDRTRKLSSSLDMNDKVAATP